MHVNAELARNSQGINDVRGGLHSLNLRLAVLEAKVVLYAGFGAGLVTFVVNLFFHR